ncbi:Putative survival protein SurE-like phosphatase/nucleotidase [Septoria linicola]|uniref:Survival protein SurE-like phosphatase/nucleotidase n=1 Tax=Septoria linicola TaxID=215465 RepID=A0A9Q9AMT2_9PEZI|nr:putative survival protein SurE-like phosphatase/nucleotidase [Septoria linicola]USW49823.1 Putative survival protein SurE-like phosphatase/nucleotidase [Septoria linicola]
MHILASRIIPVINVTNDDGPPSSTSSPYVLPFVQALEAAGHTVSVIVPDTQRSWIGKAHIVGQDVRATYYWPPAQAPEEHRNPASNGSDNGSSSHDNGTQPWVLVNGTPAGCAQLGLSHFFNDRGPVDLVISGPNYGRNTTAVFALSSGTLGAALEASVCGYKAIALSFAFFDRTNDPAIVAESCKQGVRVAEYLYKNASWSPAQLYSVNVPVKKGCSEAPVRWTKMLQNQWNKGACFEELSSANAVDDPASEEAKLRQQEAKGGDQPKSNGDASASENKWKHRHFKWAPRFTDVYDSVKSAGPGSDGWAVQAGETSITALKANFMHAEGFEGEVKL